MKEHWSRRRSVSRPQGQDCVGADERRGVIRPTLTWPLCDGYPLGLQVTLEPIGDAMHQVSEVQLFAGTMRLPRINDEFGRDLLVL